MASRTRARNALARHAAPQYRILSGARAGNFRPHAKHRISSPPRIKRPAQVIGSHCRSFRVRLLHTGRRRRMHTCKPARTRNGSLSEEKSVRPDRISVIRSKRPLARRDPFPRTQRLPVLTPSALGVSPPTLASRMRSARTTTQSPSQLTSLFLAPDTKLRPPRPFLASPRSLGVRLPAKGMPRSNHHKRSRA